MINCWEEQWGGTSVNWRTEVWPVARASVQLSYTVGDVFKAKRMFSEWLFYGCVRVVSSRYPPSGALVRPGEGKANTVTLAGTIEHAVSGKGPVCRRNGNDEGTVAKCNTMGHRDNTDTDYQHICVFGCGYYGSVSILRSMPCMKKHSCVSFLLFCLQSYDFFIVLLHLPHKVNYYEASPSLQAASTDRPKINLGLFLFSGFLQNFFHCKMLWQGAMFFHCVSAVEPLLYFSAFLMDSSM